MFAAIRQFGNRATRSIRRQGAAVTVRELVSRVYNRLFRRILYVWVWRSGAETGAKNPDVVARRFDSIDEMSDSALSVLQAADSQFQRQLRDELAGGGVLWVGFVDDRAAGYQFTRTGDREGAWHLPLTERDVLVYGAVTLHEFRGRGVASTLLAEICRREVPANGRACAICKTWNDASIRTLSKAGFNRVGEAKPLPGHLD